MGAANNMKKYKMFPEIDSNTSTINYWWFRYLMVTELYMVEKWERITIHVILALIFSMFWYFNYSVVLSLAGSFLGHEDAAAAAATTSNNPPQTMLINDVIIPTSINSYAS